MANSKISALTALAGSAVDMTSDVLPIVDTSVTETKKILVSELSLAQNLLDTEQNTTSGDSKQFTIPTWATKITLCLVGVSIDATSCMSLKFANGGTRSYKGAVLRSSTGAVSTRTGSGAGIRLTSEGTQTAAMTIEGVAKLRLAKNDSSYIWSVMSVMSTSNAATEVYRGSWRMTATTQPTLLELTSGIFGATANFDAGTVNIYYS